VTMSLATPWQDQGHGARATYGQFVEGHGTRDLRQARLLLESLP
jgi:hypothetical protein